MLGVRRAEGQELERIPTLVSASSTISSKDLPSRTLTLDLLSSSAPSDGASHRIEKMRHETAIRDHEFIFGKDSPVLLIWPDHYLSYEHLGGMTSFSGEALRDTLQAEGRRLILDGTTSPHAFEDSVSTVRATTSLLGPAAFPITERSPEFPPLIAVVGFDSARPRSLALKSLAGITCPTFMFTHLLSREDLHTFVRFHESGHVFQHLSGRILPNDVETAYERCRVEAEADVFASLWWQKTHGGDLHVPNFFSHLRHSNFIECAVSGNKNLTLQYSTVIPLQASIARGELLWKSGQLSQMSSEEVYCMARSIVSNSLPTEHQLTATIRELHEVLAPHWKEPFHRRIAGIRAFLSETKPPAPLEEAIQKYLQSIDFLTEPAHISKSHPHLSRLTLTQQAQELWLEELIDDLKFSHAPALVIDRYELELSSTALALWRLSVTSSKGDAIKDYIKHSGSPDEFFVPSETKSRLLSDVKEVVIQRLNNGTWPR
jgi:hypothetical protein